MTSSAHATTPRPAAAQIAAIASLRNMGWTSDHRFGNGAVRMVHPYVARATFVRADGTVSKFR